MTTTRLIRLRHIGIDALRKTIAAVFLLLVTTVASAQKEAIIEEEFDGRSVMLIIPAGFCYIPKDAGAEMYAIMNRLQNGMNTVAAMFMDCKELAIVARDPGYVVKRHGMYLFNRTNGQEKALPESADRGTFVAKMLEAEMGGRGVESKKDFISTEISKRLLAEKQLGVGVGGINVGIIDHTPDTLYYGMGMTASHAGRDKRVSAVLAMTVLNRVVVNLNLYDDHDPKNGFTRLLAASKQVSAKLDQFNR